MAEKVLYQIIINLNITCQLLLSALIFYLPLRRKRYFALWLLCSAHAQISCSRMNVNEISPPSSRTA